MTFKIHIKPIFKNYMTSHQKEKHGIYNYFILRTHTIVSNRNTNIYIHHIWVNTFHMPFRELISSPLIQYSCRLSELLQLYTCKSNWNKITESKFLLVFKALKGKLLAFNILWAKNKTTTLIYFERGFDIPLFEFLFI